MVWNCCDIAEREATIDNIVEITAKETKIQAVYQAVVEFVKWHNEN